MRVQIDNLTAKYGDSTAVDDLSIDIADGEMLVLLGPSGCGKTTTMRCIAGLETPARGRIQIGEKVVFDANSGVNTSVNRRGLGMVFQSYAIWPHMSVAENVAFPLSMQRVSKSEIRPRVADALRMVGLSGKEDQSASLLSGGQMQRIAFARSIIARPRTLLLDEPLSNLDARLRDQLRFELREVQQELGITAIYVTHDQQEALALADRIVVMKEGRIVQAGPPSDVYRRPKTVFVARFLGVENILHGAESMGPDGNRIFVADGDRLVVEIPHEHSGRVSAVGFRADGVSIRPGGSRSPSSPNLLRGRVRSQSYLGDRVRLLVGLDEGSHLEVMRSAEEPNIANGEEVELHLSMDRVHLLEDER